ncbi:MAG: transmembrane protein EpsG [Algoriphagus sp.]|jgi:transmembrane protein EpsG
MKRLSLDYNLLILSAAFLVLVPIVGLRLFGLDADYFNYYDLIILKNKLDLITKEFGFRVLLSFNSLVFNDSIDAFFLIFAVLGISIKFYAFSKFSALPLLSLVLYLFSYFLLHDYTQIRAGVSAGIFLLSINDLSEGNRSAYLKKIVIACLFHWTALILIPIYFIVKKFTLQFFFLLPFVGIVVYLSKINIESLVIRSIQDYPALALYYLSHSGHDSAVNIFNLINLAFLVLFVGIYVIIVFELDEFTKVELDLFKIFSLSLFSFYFFAILNKPVVAFRIFEYLNVVLLLLIPSVVLKFKQWYLASIFFVGFFLVYFYHLLVNVQIIP